MSAPLKILVVDDSQTQLLHMQAMLAQDGYAIELAEDGEQALVKLAESSVDLVLTDLQMPKMNGLELVEAIRTGPSPVPVILTTSEGSEQIAAEALHRGAASYVPKSFLSTMLLSTVRRVLEVARAAQSQQELANYITRAGLHLELASDTSLVPSVIFRLEGMLKELKICDDSQCMQVAMALDEALTNAVVHGNLEVSSDLRQREDGAAYDRMIRQRQRELPYAERRVHIHVCATRECAKFVIRDEGPGFCVKDLPDPTDPANLDKHSGRGLLLINAFMDEVWHNDAGNEITLVKRPGNGDSEEDDDDDDD